MLPVTTSPCASLILNLFKYAYFKLFIINKKYTLKTTADVGFEAGSLAWNANVESGHINYHKNSSGDEIANVNFITTISHTRRPTSKYRKETNLLLLTN